MCVTNACFTIGIFVNLLVTVSITPFLEISRLLFLFASPEVQIKYYTYRRINIFDRRLHLTCLMIFEHCMSRN